MNYKLGKSDEYEYKRIRLLLEDSLYKQLEFDVSEIYLLGDAKEGSNNIYGIWEAFEVANHI